jgi:hypothetical protein
MMELFDLGNQDSLQQPVVQRVIIPCSLVFWSSKMDERVEKRFFDAYVLQMNTGGIVLYCTICVMMRIAHSHAAL